MGKQAEAPLAILRMNGKALHRPCFRLDSDKDRSGEQEVTCLCEQARVMNIV